jgi:hypothetical protein
VCVCVAMAKRLYQAVGTGLNLMNSVWHQGVFTQVYIADKLKDGRKYEHTVLK